MDNINKMNNKYIYVFDYSFGHIYEISIDSDKLDKINDGLDKIDKYLYKNYYLKPKEIHYMISNKKLEIETINKI